MRPKYKRKSRHGGYDGRKEIEMTNDERILNLSATVRSLADLCTKLQEENDLLRYELKQADGQNEFLCEEVKKNEN